MEPEPIPLRTLTVLLNYERVISDPRFKGVQLMKSSLADPGMIDRAKVNYASLLSSVPKTTVYLEPSPPRISVFYRSHDGLADALCRKMTLMNIFEPYAEAETTDPPSTI